MKYIFLFVNPSSGGNRASIFTELGIKEIIFHKPEVCHIFIYDILDGEKGKKPGFINLSYVMKNIHTKNENKEMCNDHGSKSFKQEKTPTEDQTVKIMPLDTPIESNKLKNEAIRHLNKFKTAPVNAAKRTAFIEEEECECEQIKTNDVTKCEEKTEGEQNGTNKKTSENVKKKKGKAKSAAFEKVVENEKGGKENVITSSKEDELKDVHIYVLVAGGDGTINWVLKESEQYDISNDDFAIGVIPFGTGNDFARAFGWKKMEVTLNHVHLIQILKKIVEHVLKAKLEKHDYWNINVTLKGEGYFNKINSKTKKKETLRENNENVKTLNLCMSNYFSIGIDSRIGRGFERHRKKNAVCNKMVYALEGFKKITFKKNIPVNLIIDKMVKGKEFDEVVFTTNSSISASNNYPLLKNAVSIVCINIPSFSSGNDIWQHTHKIGLKLPNNLSNQDKTQYEQLKEAQQELGDEMLEFVIYQSGIDLGLEFTLKGRAYRIHQSKGPWKIYFKDQKYNVYFQVDGEFYLMSLPDFICIEHYKKVNVLKNIMGK